MPFLPSDPLFYLTAIPAVILIGLSKGGLGGAMSLIGVPLMTLTMPPFQAVAILLPILVVMDLASLWAWWGFRDPRTLKIMLPGAVLGVGIGWAAASVVTDEAVRLLIGVIGFLFVGRWLVQKIVGREEARPHRPVVGALWSVVAGFTSFVAHAGGPPYQIYTLPLRQDPKLFTGTSVIFFAVVNAVKLIPYYALGELGAHNLSASLVLAPIAPLATFAGAWVVKRLKPEIFYPFMYAMILIISLDLIWVGTAALIN
jgi:uncharacterized membrane protein YfcA